MLCVSSVCLSSARQCWHLSSYAQLPNAMQVTAVTPHPTHQYFVTASMDKTWAFYDADTASCLVQVINLMHGAFCWDLTQSSTA